MYTGASPIARTDSAYNITVPVSYHAQADHAAGPIKDDSEGIPFPTGQITAGTKTSNTVTYTPQRKAFFGPLSTTTVPGSSAFVRALGSSAMNPGSGTVLVAVAAVGARGVCFAYPSSLGPVSSIVQLSLGMDVKAGFTEIALLVDGANGILPVSYRVYYILPAFPFSTVETYTLTI